MGRLFLVSLEGKIYSCKHCHTHLALSDDILSKAFYCKHGKAYLFNKVFFKRAARCTKLPPYGVPGRVYHMQPYFVLQEAIFRTRTHDF